MRHIVRHVRHTCACGTRKKGPAQRAEPTQVENSGTVVGWTNDTGYGGYGQKVVLTFDTYREGWSKAQITDLSFR